VGTQCALGISSGSHQDSGELGLKIRVFKAINPKFHFPENGIHYLETVFLIMVSGFRIMSVSFEVTALWFVI
jgi:hypothetical protein